MKFKLFISWSFGWVRIIDMYIDCVLIMDSLDTHNCITAFYEWTAWVLLLTITSSQTQREKKMKKGHWWGPKTKQTVILPSPWVPGYPSMILPFGVRSTDWCLGSKRDLSFAMLVPKCHSESSGTATGLWGVVVFFFSLHHPTCIRVSMIWNVASYFQHHVVHNQLTDWMELHQSNSTQ